MQVDGTRLYRVRDVAEHFDVSVATIYRAIESGQLTALKLGTGTGTLRVTGAAIRSYEQACIQAAHRSWFPGGVAVDGAAEQSSVSESVGQVAG